MEIFGPFGVEFCKGCEIKKYPVLFFYMVVVRFDKYHTVEDAGFFSSHVYLWSLYQKSCSFKNVGLYCSP